MAVWEIWQCAGWWVYGANVTSNIVTLIRSPVLNTPEQVRGWGEVGWGWRVRSVHCYGGLESFLYVMTFMRDRRGWKQNGHMNMVSEVGTGVRISFSSTSKPPLRDPSLDYYLSPRRTNSSHANKAKKPNVNCSLTSACFTYSPKRLTLLWLGWGGGGKPSLIGGPFF